MLDSTRFAAGVATAVALALVGLSPAQGVPGPELESVWEQGTVQAVPDGDTVDASMTSASLPSNLGQKRVRTVGVQAPEVGSPPQCGAIQSRDRLREKFPSGAAIQTRSLYDTSYDNYSDGRIVRSLYAQDSEDNWYDTARGIISDGWLLWFPLAPDSPTKPEWAHNLEYRTLADDAAAGHRGIWTPGLCGPSASPSANLRVWVAYIQSATLDQVERVFVANDGAEDVSLAGWTVRDAALNIGTFPPGAVVHAGKVVELQLTASPVSAYPGVAASYVAGSGPWFDNLPANNVWFHGDAAYLMDPATSYATGNLRDWFAYPCNPDSCGDPLRSRVAISYVQNLTPPAAAPSAPGSVTARPATDGTGAVNVGWAAPYSFGGPSVSYTVRAYQQLPGGGPAASPTATVGSIAGTSTSVTGLPVGVKFLFSVTADGPGGSSAAVLTTAAVRPSPGPTFDPASPPSAVPPAVANPWASGQYVDVRNTSAATVDLGGYGLWTQSSSAPPTDQPAYLFPAKLLVAPGSAVRVRIGNPTDGPASQPGVISYLRTGEPGVGLTGAGATDFLAWGQYVELANLNRAQVSCAANGGTCRPGEQTQTLPSPPVGITAASVPGSVTVSWGAPIATGGLPITNYVAVAYSEAVGGSVLASCQSTSFNCSFAAAVGPVYYVEVTAANALGPSAPSSRVVASPRTVPAAPTAVTAAGHSGSASVSWTPGAANGARISHFTARAYLYRTGGQPVAACTTEGSSCQVGGLGKYQTYFIDVAATNKVGEGPASSARVEVRTTGAATAVSTYSRKKVTVRWAKQPGVTRYEAVVYDAPAGGTRLGSCSGRAKATKCTTKKVKKRKLYYIDLTYLSPAGNHLVVPRIVTGPARKPSPPTSVSATAQVVGKGTKVTIAWDEPTTTGYSPLTSYRAAVYAKPKGGSSRASCSASGKRLSCTTKTTKKLRRGVTYWVSAKVRNKKGWSGYASPRVPITVP